LRTLYVSFCVYLVARRRGGAYAGSACIADWRSVAVHRSDSGDVLPFFRKALSGSEETLHLYRVTAGVSASSLAESHSMGKVAAIQQVSDPRVVTVQLSAGGL